MSSSALPSVRPGQIRFGPLQQHELDSLEDDFALEEFLRFLRIDGRVVDLARAADEGIGDVRDTSYWRALISKKNCWVEIRRGPRVSTHTMSNSLNPVDPRPSTSVLRESLQ